MKIRALIYALCSFMILPLPARANVPSYQSDSLDSTRPRNRRLSVMESCRAGAGTAIQSLNYQTGASVCQGSSATAPSARNEDNPPAAFDGSRYLAYREDTPQVKRFLDFRSSVPPVGPSSPVQAAGEGGANGKKDQQDPKKNADKNKKKNQMQKDKDHKGMHNKKYRYALIGALIGSIGGPIGALIGALIGYMLGAEEDKADMEKMKKKEMEKKKKKEKDGKTQENGAQEEQEDQEEEEQSSSPNYS